MKYIVLTEHRAERIVAKAQDDIVVLAQWLNHGHSSKYRAITLNWDEALRLAEFLQVEARKEMMQCRTLNAELSQKFNIT